MRFPLLALLVLPLHATVRIHPGQATVAPGGTLAFTATLQLHRPSPAWTWTLVSGPGSIHPDTGVYQALPEPGLARVRAELRGEPLHRGEATVTTLPLPGDVLRLVDQIQGEGWVEPYTASLPFLDPETDLRLGPGGVTSRLNLHRDRRTAGYGLPLTLSWTPPPDTVGQFLTYREGQSWVRRDVTGRNQTTLAPRDRIRDCRVECLYRRTFPPDKWESWTYHFPIRVRGVLPALGDPTALPDHRDGVGLGARFAEPFGMAAVGPYRLIADRGAHVVRLVSPEDRVTTLAGVPFEAGHRDSPPWPTRLARVLGLGRAPGPPLFHAPTYLVAWSTSGLLSESWKALVADSGNHVLRVLESNGQVRTFAGRPGQPGYQDADRPLEAQFRNPQGLVRLPSGHVFVADQGNHVIRVIAPGGQVTTLAGHPGTPGHTDGIGPQARFSDLKALALDEGVADETTLLALDGHALRIIRWPGGEVTTWLGCVAHPGLPPGPGPCFRDPTDLAVQSDGCYIADRGNGCLRRITSHGRNETLAGGPNLPGFRWGLTCGSGPDLPDEALAALGQPRTLLLPETDPVRSFLAATGAGVVRVHLRSHGENRLTTWFEPGEALLFLHTEASGGARNLHHRTVHCRVQFLEADGSLLEETRKVLPLDGSLPLVPPPEAASAQAFCVTDQGSVSTCRVDLPRESKTPRESR